MSMRKQTIWFGLGMVGAVVLGIYAYLGGFRPIEVRLIEREEYTLIGNYYEGQYDNDTLGHLFFNAKALIQGEGMPGTLTIVNYSPEAEGDTVSLFIGVLLDTPRGEQVPEGLEKRTIKGGKVLRASIHAHHLVMPSRDKVDEKLKAFATESHISLRPLSLEQYLAEDSLQIDKIVQ